MNAAILFSAGVLSFAAAADIAIAVRYYRLFPALRKRWWPGAGLWMAWKGVLMLRNARNRLLNIHAMASTFDPNTAHRDETRAFISMVKKATDISGAVKVTVEHKQADEVKP